MPKRENAISFGNFSRRDVAFGQQASVSSTADTENETTEAAQSCEFAGALPLSDGT